MSKPVFNLIAILTCVLSLITPILAGNPPAVVGPAPENEASLVRLPDDSLRIFYVDRPAGEELRSITSTDNGRTWSEPKLEFKLPGIAYYANYATLDADGEVQMVFHVRGQGKNGYRDRHYNIWHTKTAGGRTAWTAPKEIYNGYVGSLRGFTMMKSGRLVLPLGIAKPDRMKAPETGDDLGWNDIVVFTSDDKGDTWQRGPDNLTVVQDRQRGRTRYGVVEPHTVELLDGRVWMLSRTKNGHLYESFSSDGIRWSQPKPSAFISSDSPATTARLKDGRLVMFLNACQRWNDLLSYAIGGRETLHAAISDDDGKTWHGFREVLYDPYPPGKGDRGTAYGVATEMADGNVLLVSGQGDRRRSILIIDPNWLTETTASVSFAKQPLAWTAYEAVGTDLVAHPDKAGEQVLAIRKTDLKAESGAVWNFPMGEDGTVQVRVKLPAGSAGGTISLTDHYSVTGDTQADANAVATIALTADGRIGDAAAAVGQWHDVELAWSSANTEVTVTVDGNYAGSVQHNRPPVFGINYLRVRSTATAIDEAGILVESASADVGAATKVLKRSARAAEAGPTRIVFLGDSITKGDRPARNGRPAVAEHETFVSLVAKSLATVGVAVDVVNAGKPSDRTDGALKRFDTDVLAQDPQVVVVMFGTNDSCFDKDKTGPRLPSEQFKTNLQEIVRRVRDAGATPILMTEPSLGSQWSLSRNPVYAEKGRNFPLGQFMEVTRTVARDAQVPLIDHFAAWEATDLAQVDARLTDGCHPNAEGHRVLADAITPVLLAQLKRTVSQTN